jgi:CheY-like chemotaxis protein
VVIRVSTELETDLPQVMGNASEIREALTNLIFNAVDAMPQGGVLTVKTVTLPPAASGTSRVRLEVGDTGPGMNEETRRRCPEPFFTTKGERGTGLGLTMVQGAARRHGAELDIDSAPGEGTRVRLDFDATADAQRKRMEARAAAEVAPLRLLLVDDDPAVLSSTEFVLQLSNHDVTTADGGQAAIKALRAAHKAGLPFDLVITDLGMPYVDGNQVASAVKELFPSTPVVLLTGWGRRMARTDATPAHIDYVLPKPLELDQLREIFVEISRGAR